MELFGSDMLFDGQSYINVSYGVNPLIISALWECLPPAAAKRIYGASKSQKSLCDF
jgi:hypothetical protein